MTATLELTLLPDGLIGVNTWGLDGPVNIVIKRGGAPIMVATYREMTIDALTGDVRAWMPLPRTLLVNVPPTEQEID